MTDPRFDTSKWDTSAAAASTSTSAAASGSRASPSASASSSSSRAGSQSGAESEDALSGSDEGDSDGSYDDEEGDEDEEFGASDGDSDAPIVQPLTPEELAAFQRKQSKRGIVYISRIPPGMTPPKVRHLLSGFGEVDRIYLQDGRKKEREAETGKKKSSRRTNFTEGWIEFAKKSVAKIVASTLNAQPIGFSSGGRASNKNARRWRDDVWTMKYLSGFKWHMLSEQMAHERAARQARLRTELSQSRMEQADYLRKVERARVQKDKEEKRRRRAEAKGLVQRGDAPTTAEAISGPGGKIRTFKQRQPVSRDVRDQRAEGGKKRSAPTEGKEGRGDAKRTKSKPSRAPPAASSSGALDGVLSKIL